RARARQGRDDRAGLQRSLQIGVREELAVPLQGEARERETRNRRLVEREDEQDHDRRVEEEHDEREEAPQEPGGVLRERDVHQRAATWPVRRKREKTTVSAATTTSRKIESTDPVSQSGKPPRTGRRSGCRRGSRSHRRRARASRTP